MKGVKRYQGTGLNIRHSTHLVDILGDVYRVDKEKIMWVSCLSVRLPMTSCQLTQNLSERADVQLRRSTLKPIFFCKTVSELVRIYGRLFHRFGYHSIWDTPIQKCGHFRLSVYRFIVKNNLHIDTNGVFSSVAHNLFDRLLLTFCMEHVHWTLLVNSESEWNWPHFNPVAIRPY